MLTLMLILLADHHPYFLAPWSLEQPLPAGSQLTIPKYRRKSYVDCVEAVDTGATSALHLKDGRVEIPSSLHPRGMVVDVAEGVDVVGLLARAAGGSPMQKRRRRTKAE
jgi:hypothetical protein